MLTPMILIGPGTGIAPFIGFLEHRQAQNKEKQEGSATASKSISEGTWRGGFEIEEEEEVSHSKNTLAPLRNKDQTNLGTIDVYFGCRHKDHDWLYERKMKDFKEQDIISNLNIAFSRDNKTKQYVQDKIKQNVDRVIDLIVHKNATIYICGDGNAMAKDVQEAIKTALEKKSSENTLEKLTIEKLKEDNRLILDIWS